MVTRPASHRSNQVLEPVATRARVEVAIRRCAAYRLARCRMSGSRIHATNSCICALSPQYPRPMGPHWGAGMAYIPRWNVPAKTIARRFPERSADARWLARPPPTVCRETRSGVSFEAMTPDSPAPTPSAARWASPSRSVPREATPAPRSLPPSRCSAIPFRPRVGARTRPCEGIRFLSGTPRSQSCWPDSRNTGRSLSRRTAIGSQQGSPPYSNCRERAEDGASARGRIARMALRRPGSHPLRMAVGVPVRPVLPSTNRLCGARSLHRARLPARLHGKVPLASAPPP